MSSGHNVVDEAFVGGSEQIRSEWQTIRVTFRNFAALPSKRGDAVTDSPVLECHGLKWRIDLYPGGHANSSEEDVFLSIYLTSLSSSNKNPIEAARRFRIPSSGKVFGSAKKKLNNLMTNPHPGATKIMCSDLKFLIDRRIILLAAISLLKLTFK